MSFSIDRLNGLGAEVFDNVLRVVSDPADQGGGKRGQEGQPDEVHARLVGYDAAVVGGLVGVGQTG